MTPLTPITRIMPIYGYLSDLPGRVLVACTVAQWADVTSAARAGARLHMQSAAVTLGAFGMFLALTAGCSKDADATPEQEADARAEVPSPAYAPSSLPSVAPMSAARLARHHILISKPRGIAEITKEQAISAAADGSLSSPAPAAELNTVTVDGLGRPDRTGEIDNLIENRLIWVVTFPPREVSHGGDLFSGPTGGLSQSVVLHGCQDRRSSYSPIPSPARFTPPRQLHANQREAFCVKGWGSGPWLVVGPCIAVTELLLDSV